jgi:hypothetical protein
VSSSTVTVSSAAWTLSPKTKMMLGGYARGAGVIDLASDSMPPQVGGVKRPLRGRWLTGWAAGQCARGRERFPVGVNSVVVISDSGLQVALVGRLRTGWLR